MHEMSIATAILRKVRERLRQLDPSVEVSEVHITVGTFRNVDPESLQFAFDFLKSGYVDCAKSRLVLEVVDARAICREKGHEFRFGPQSSYRCPVCGSQAGELVAGEELEIRRIVAFERKPEAASVATTVSGPVSQLAMPRELSSHEGETAETG